MRVYQREVLAAWRKGKRLSRPSMFTDGKDVWSYGYHFPLLINDYKNHRLLVNNGKVSVTTSSQQRAVVAEISSDFVYTDEKVQHGNHSYDVWVPR